MAIDSEINKNNILYGLLNVAIGFIVYAALAFYYSGYLFFTSCAKWEIVSEAMEALECLLHDREVLAGLSVALATWVSWKLCCYRLRWYENLVAVLMAVMSILDRLYVNNTNDSWRILYASPIRLLASLVTFWGLFVLFRYTIIVFKKILNFFLYKPVVWGETLRNWHQRFHRHIFWYSFILMALFWLPFAIIRYPAGMEHDAYYQIEQYLGLRPMTLHWPVASNVFMGSVIQLGNYLFGSLDAAAFLLVIVQMLIAAAVLAYTLQVSQELKASERWINLILLIYLTAPIYPICITTIFKDSLYASVLVWFVTLIAKLFNTGVDSKKMYLAVGISAFLSCILRNNGIFIIAFELLGFSIFAAFTKEKKDWHGRLFITLTVTLALALGYSVYVTKFSGIPTGNGGIKEALSIPFQQTARYVRDHGAEVTAEERNIIDSVLDYSKLPVYYTPWLSDFVKNTYRGDNSKLPDYFRVWARQFFRHPDTYVEAAISTVSGFFAIRGPLYLWDGPHNRDYMHYSEPQALKPFRMALINWAEFMYLLPLVNLPNIAAVQIYVAMILFMQAVSEKRGLWACLMIPSVVTVLVCIASPTFYQAAGFRYALSIIYSSPFLLGLSTRCGMIGGSVEPDLDQESSFKHTGKYLLVAGLVTFCLTAYAATKSWQPSYPIPRVAKLVPQGIRTLKVDSPRDFWDYCAVGTNVLPGTEPLEFRIFDGARCDIVFIYKGKKYEYRAVRLPWVATVDLCRTIYSDDMHLSYIRPCAYVNLKTADSQDVVGIYREYPRLVSELFWEYRGIRYNIVALHWFDDNTQANLTYLAQLAAQQDTH
ncbi:MAG: DUF6020 family protein [bacterium]|nr:DUF6020 family protein [bacterium]